MAILIETAGQLKSRQPCPPADSIRDYRIEL